MNTTLFRWPVRVYYEDTDAGGMVYHASYLAFYERARTEMLRYHQISQHRLLSERIAFVVRQMTLDYFSPARLDDLLEVQTKITSSGGVTLLFNQQIVNSDQRLLNKAQVLIACVDPQLMKPRKLPAFIIQELQA